MRGGGLGGVGAGAQVTCLARRDGHVGVGLPVHLLETDRAGVVAPTTGAGQSRTHLMAGNIWYRRVLVRGLWPEAHVC